METNEDMIDDNPIEEDDSFFEEEYFENNF
jgi:hypothetical protein